MPSETVENREEIFEGINNYGNIFMLKEYMIYQKRFELNPLRILDCKNIKDQIIIKDAPTCTKFFKRKYK